MLGKSANHSFALLSRLATAGFALAGANSPVAAATNSSTSVLACNCMVFASVMFMHTSERKCKTVVAAGTANLVRESPH